MKTIEGQLSAKRKKIALVAARFNSFITARLVEGAEDMFRRHGGNEDDLSLVWVPGAFEIPLAADRLAASGQYDAIVCLGAVIRGSTPHFDYVCAEVSKGVATVSLHRSLPVIFSVLTTDSIEQAVERAGTKAGNKGSDGMLAALEMADVLQNLAGN